MDVLSPLLHLLFRAFVVVLPLTTGWLAIRRLILSKSTNAWIYAVTFLFAAVTFAGLLPWTLGFGKAGWVFFLFAAFCPAIWIGVVMMCDANRVRKSTYEPDPIIEPAPTFVSKQPATPLILENPDWPGTPIPVFRHKVVAKPAAAASAFQPDADQSKSKTILSIVREMRKNRSSDDRRPKLLPPPDASELPFLNRG